MKLRYAKAQDLTSIYELEISRFEGDVWNKDHWRYELEENKFSKTILLIDSNNVIGYVNYWITFEQATINKVCVHQNYIRQGLGDKLIKAVTKKLDKLNVLSTTLEVRVSNQAAYKLYLKNDFKILLRKENYYSDGEDCFYMVRYIGGCL